MSGRRKPAFALGLTFLVRFATLYEACEKISLGSRRNRSPRKEDTEVLCTRMQNQFAGATKPQRTAAPLAHHAPKQPYIPSKPLIFHIFQIISSAFFMFTVRGGVLMGPARFW